MIAPSVSFRDGSSLLAQGFFYSLVSWTFLMFLQRWQDLLATLDVSGGAAPLGDASDIRLFEDASKIILPSGFKEYCVVFGSGIAADNFTIPCPSRRKDQWDLMTFGTEHLGYFKDAVNFEIQHSLDGYPALDYSQMKSLEKLLDGAFPFATNPNAELFVWKLDTYSALDGAYDIWRLPLAGC